MEVQYVTHHYEMRSQIQAASGTTDSCSTRRALMKMEFLLCKYCLIVCHEMKKDML
jgi:hypothetical protein